MTKSSDEAPRHLHPKLRRWATIILLASPAISVGSGLAAPELTLRHPPPPLRDYRWIRISDQMVEGKPPPDCILPAGPPYAYVLATAGSIGLFVRAIYPSSSMLLRARRISGGSEYHGDSFFSPIHCFMDFLGVCRSPWPTSIFGKRSSGRHFSIINGCLAQRSWPGSPALKAKRGPMCGLQRLHIISRRSSGNMRIVWLSIRFGTARGSRQISRIFIMRGASKITAAVSSSNERFLKRRRLIFSGTA